MALAGRSKTAPAAAAAPAAARAVTAGELELFASADDIARLEAYARNLVDYHMVMDLLPGLARLFFLGKLPDVSLSAVQTALLLGQGLQHKTLDEMEAEMRVEARQLLALFNKAVRKLVRSLRGVMEKQAEEEMAPALAAARQRGAAAGGMAPVAQSLGEDLADADARARTELSAQQRSLLQGMDLEEYAVRGSDKDWARALSGSEAGAASVVSVRNKDKTAQRRDEAAAAIQEAALRRPRAAKSRATRRRARRRRRGQGPQATAERRRRRRRRQRQAAQEEEAQRVGWARRTRDPARQRQSGGVAAPAAHCTAQQWQRQAALEGIPSPPLRGPRSASAIKAAGGASHGAPPPRDTASTEAAHALASRPRSASSSGIPPGRAAPLGAFMNARSSSSSSLDSAARSSYERTTTGRSSA